MKTLVMPFTRYVKNILHFKKEMPLRWLGVMLGKDYFEEKVKRKEKHKQTNLIAMFKQGQLHILMLFLKKM